MKSNIIYILCTLIIIYPSHSLEQNQSLKQVFDSYSNKVEDYSEWKGVSMNYYLTNNEPDNPPWYHPTDGHNENPYKNETEGDLHNSTTTSSTTIPPHQTSTLTTAHHTTDEKTTKPNTITTTPPTPPPPDTSSSSPPNDITKATSHINIISLSTTTSIPTSYSTRGQTSTMSPDEETENNLEKVNTTLDDMESSQKLDSPSLLKIGERLNEILSKQHLTSNKSLLGAVNILGKMEKHARSIQKDEMANFTDNMLENCNDVLDHNQAWQNLTDCEKKIEISSKILEYIQTTGFSMGCNKNMTKKDKIIKSNIVIEAYSLDSKAKMNIQMNGSKSGIIVPAGLPQPDPDSQCEPGTAVGAIVGKLTDYLAVRLEKHKQINSKIVAFSIKNSLNSTQLPNGVPPVRIKLEHKELLQWGDTVDCVYWDFIQNKWSTNGCRFVQMYSTRRLSVCECTHLTNFAALMDVSGRETDTKVKDILTKVCCGLSIVCLILTIAFLTLIRSLRNRRNNITSNLCFCQLIVNLLVVFGMDSTQNNILCQSVAVLLLYFILCSFSWMVMEGYHLYQMIVLVFANVGHFRRTYMYVFSYGVPLIITICTLLSIGFKDILETDSYFCWISSPSNPHRVWAVAGPAMVAIFINSIFLILALKEAYSAKIRKKQIYQVDSHDNTIKIISEKLSQLLSRLQGFVSLLLLLGIPWISFVLYINRFGQSFAYVFIVVNGLQGVFMFVFQILLNEKSRALIRKVYYRNISSQSFFTTSKNTSMNSERSQTTDTSNRS